MTPGTAAHAAARRLAESVNPCAPPRVMPSMAAVVDYWASQGADPRWASWYIGWGEPFCFGCAWLPPVDDRRKDSWHAARIWLDRAHLEDHCAHGDDSPPNIVPLCGICHRAMPEFDDRDAALAWVTARPRRSSLWQIWTDAHLKSGQTLIHRWADFLELMASADAPPLTPAQIASLATLLALATAYPQATPNAATAATTIANLVPRVTKRDEARHAHAT
jgi:hypothetical protein